MYFSLFAELFVLKEGELNLDFHLAYEELLLVPLLERECAKLNTDEARLRASQFCYPRYLRMNPGKALQILFVFLELDQFLTSVLQGLLFPLNVPVELS